MHRLIGFAIFPTIFPLDGRKSIESPPTRIGRIHITNFLLIVLTQPICSLPSIDDTSTMVKWTVARQRVSFCTN